jgi:glutamine cyclotransferase
MPHSTVPIMLKTYWRTGSLLACLAILLASCNRAPGQLCAAVKPMSFQVQGEIRRDMRGFTQGLELHGGTLFESTGALAGDTRLTTVDAAGKVTEIANFAKAFFGEGLTILRDQIYQLSWREHKVFVYDLHGKQLRSMANPREGWGMTNDGVNLIASDGGNRLYFVNPATFTLMRSVQVRAGGRPVSALNELENAGGKIYSNIFTTWNIVRIDPASGCVEAVANLHSLWDRMSDEEHRYLESDANFVLNGIAYDASSRLFYVTGKNWRTIFMGRFLDADVHRP